MSTSICFDALWDGIQQIAWGPGFVDRWVIVVVFPLGNTGAVTHQWEAARRGGCNRMGRHRRGTIGMSSGSKFAWLTNRPSMRKLLVSFSWTFSEGLAWPTSSTLGPCGYTSRSQNKLAVEAVET